MAHLAQNNLDALGVLGEPVRRALYQAVLDAEAPVSRDAAASAVGIPRSTAAVHLDRLVTAGLLTAQHRRLSGRSGPGAGRPTKLYSAASVELLGSAPERHYELVAGLLATAAERADSEAIPVRTALAAAARDAGTTIGEAHAPLENALMACGYGPRDDGTGGLLLENCPFHSLATRHPDLICHANVELVRGIAEAAGDARTVALAPRSGRCCVAIRASDAPAAA